MPQSFDELVRSGPFPPIRSGDHVRVNVDLLEEASSHGPLPSMGWIHHLQHSSVASPYDYKVSERIGQPHNYEGRQRSRFRLEEVISRNHHLLGIETEL